jgi:acyl carrier protein
VSAGDPLFPRVWKTLAEVARADRVPREPSAACPLGVNGFWFDSIDFMDAILACEDAFGITFDLETDFDASRLCTVADLVRLVRERGGQ